MKNQSDCVKCERLQKRINHLEKQLAKYKKQVVRTRHRVNELEFLAEENEIVAVREEIEDLKVDVEDLGEEFDKPEEYNNLDEEEVEPELVEVTRFDVATGQTITEMVERFNPNSKRLVLKQEKLSYSRVKRGAKQKGVNYDYD